MSITRRRCRQSLALRDGQSQPRRDLFSNGRIGREQGRKTATSDKANN
jgi:hypothetical protein